MSPASVLSAVLSTRTALGAAVLVTLSSLFFSVGNVLAKSLTATLPGVQIALVRALVALVACLVWRSAVDEPRPSRPRLLVLRGALGGASVLLYFVALAKIQVGVATLFNHLDPIFTVLFAAVLLRELPARAAWAGLVAVVVGVALVATPALGAWPRLGAYDLMALGSAITGGAAVTVQRSLRRDHGPLTLGLAFFTGAVVVTAVPALLLWRAPTALQWGLLLLVGACNLGGQVLFTTSLKTLQAVEASVLSQLVVVFSFAGGQLFLVERLAPVGLVGAALTLGGVVVVAVAASRRPAVDEAVSPPRTS